MTSTETEITPEQAREVLRREQQRTEEEQQRRMSACQAEIAPLLEQIGTIAKKHGCSFGAKPVFTPDGRTVAQFAIENAQ